MATLPTVRSGSELTASELYTLLCLRVDVFVVEQHIAYPDLDGLDLLQTTRHFWMSNGAEVVSCLRVATEGDHRKIARVCTKREHRGRGLARVLMSAAIASFGEQAMVLEAQSYLVDFYRQFGFVVEGPTFLDDGIPHLPMRREANE